MALDSETKAYNHKVLDFMKAQTEIQKQCLVVLRQLRRDIRINHEELKEILKGEKDGLHAK